MKLNKICKLLFIVLIIISTGSANAQYKVKWMAVGSMQNWYSAIGAEKEEGYVASQQYGWQWPAVYPYQDMQADKSLWIGATNYTETSGTVRPFKVVHVGPRVTGAGEFFPVEFKVVTKRPVNYPKVDYVDTYKNLLESDEVDENLDCDELIYSEVNSSIGITVKRKVKAWSHPYLDNFNLIEYTFVNTGLIADNKTDKRADATLTDVYFGFSERLAVVREIRYYVGNNSGWGVNTMLDARGDGRIDADNPDNLRFQYAWHGYYGGSSGSFIKPASAPADWDNIGVPVVQPDGEGYLPKSDTNWRLGAPQFIGTMTVHADNSVANRTDDPAQPSTMDWVSSDGALMFSNDQYNNAKMQQEYAQLSKGRRALRHAEYIEPSGNYVQPSKDPAVGSTNAAGYKHFFAYGPYTLAPGDSITIIIADAADGITRDEAVETGLKYKNKEITTLEKNEKVFEGKDKLFATFARVKAAYDMGWENIPQPPAPPTDFLVLSRGGKIDMTWQYTADPAAPITGFHLYRSIDDNTGDNEGYSTGVYYTKYELAASLPADARAYADTAVMLNQPYYYYLTAVGQDQAAIPALGIPAGALESGRYYTQTYSGATMKREGLTGLSGKVRAVPNPYIISANQDKLLFDKGKYLNFANLPKECKIDIYTEIGEHVKSLEHTDGSGDEYWYLTTDSNQYVASGIYIAVVTDTGTGKREIVKFVVIR